MTCTETLSAPFLISPPFLRGFHLLHAMKRIFIMNASSLAKSTTVATAKRTQQYYLKMKKTANVAAKIRTTATVSNGRTLFLTNSDSSSPARPMLWNPPQSNPRNLPLSTGGSAENVIDFAAQPPGHPRDPRAHGETGHHAHVLAQHVTLRNQTR
eukprot:3830846-Rhodomonas_salina.2